MSPARDLTQKALGRIVERFGLQEDAAQASPPWRRLESPLHPEGPVGEVRLWRGEPLQQVVYVGLCVDEIALDTHSVHAFCRPDGPIPHFVFEAATVGGKNAYRLDLLARVDLGAHLQYVRYCYDLLTETTIEVNARPGLAPAPLSPLQYAMASPWMLTHTATDAAFVRTGEAVDEYLDHWFGLVEDGLATHVTSEIDASWLPERDRRARANMFDPVVDPVWGQLERVVGSDAVTELIGLLRGVEG